MVIVIGLTFVWGELTLLKATGLIWHSFYYNIFISGIDSISLVLVLVE